MDDSALLVVEYGDNLPLTKQCKTILIKNYDLTWKFEKE